VCRNIVRCNFRRIDRLKEGAVQQEQQNVAVDETNVPFLLPYNLYWQKKKIDKRAVNQLGTDSSRICK